MDKTSPAPQPRRPRRKEDDGILSELGVRWALESDVVPDIVEGLLQ